jgi:hypothetical protein
LLTYLTGCGGKLGQDEKAEVSQWVKDRSGKGERWDLGETELEQLKAALA